MEEREASDEVLEVVDASERSENVDECSENRDSQEENGLRGKEKDSAGATRKGKVVDQIVRSICSSIKRSGRSSFPGLCQKGGCQSYWHVNVL